MPGIIFSKKEFQKSDFETSTFWSKFRFFWELLQGVLVSILF